MSQLPKPYYARGGITIYHGDCRTILPLLAGDVVITDPPYNCGKAYLDHYDRMKFPAYRTWLRDILALCAASAPEVVFFPGVKNSLFLDKIMPGPLKPHRLLGWHKKEFAGDKWHGGPPHSWEPILWASTREKPQANKRFGSLGRDFLVVNATHGDRFFVHHPCPKPQPVLNWLVGLFAPEGGTVIDPFCGTGTTMFAAREYAVKGIGIEISEPYCEAATRRLEQGILPCMA